MQTVLFAEAGETPELGRVVPKLRQLGAVKIAFAIPSPACICQASRC